MAIKDKLITLESLKVAYDANREAIDTLTKELEEDISQLSEENAELKGDKVNIWKTYDTLWDDHLYNASGIYIESGSGYFTLSERLDVEGIEKVRIKNMYSSKSASTIVFLKSNDSVLSYIVLPDSNIFEVPENAKYCRVTSNVNLKTQVEYYSEVNVNDKKRMDDAIEENALLASENSLNIQKTQNILFSSTSLSAKRLGDVPKYEKQIISISTGTDDSFGPQGIATDGRYLYVTNSSGYIRKINIQTKEYTAKLIGMEVTKHANSCDFYDLENAIYVCANGMNQNNNKVVILDADTLTVKKQITLVDESNKPVYPHGIAIDRSNGNFYVALSFSENKAIILIEFDKSGKYIRKLEFENTIYSSISKSTQQGLCFDGKYFYVPLHYVNFLQGYDCILIYDRDGKYVRTQTALKGLEIEDLCYDYSRNRLFANYGYGGNFITEFVDDSGWLNLADYIETGKDNIIESTAQIRILDGVFYTRGYITVTNSGDIFRLSSRVSPHNNKVNTLCVYSEDGNLVNAKPTFVQWSSYMDKYDMQLNYAVYCPNKGKIWLEGGCVPM